jgi:hypothetical protein
LGISPARSEQLPEYAIDPGRQYAAGFARQALSTVGSFVPIDPTRLDVLDIGSGYGHTTAELALVPNKLWPIEPHYRLPFLGYLPISLANRVLRWTRRGTDYTAASYAPTYGSLRRMLAKRPELQFRFVLPADISLAQKGSSLLYRGGVRAIATWPVLWWISKALLVVAVKKSDG